jgi:hypothetical protein
MRMEISGAASQDHQHEPMRRLGNVGEAGGMGQERLVGGEVLV